MNSISSVPVGIIDVELTFPDVFGKLREELVHCVISGDDPESMLPEQLRLWCEKHSVAGRVRYRYEGTIHFGGSEVMNVGTGSWYASGDDLREPCLELYPVTAGDREDGDIPF